MTFTCPDGHPLRGTDELVGGIALAEPVLKDGKIVPEYEGETEIDWNSQVTRTRDGEDLWMCEEGGYFKASQLEEPTE